MAEWMVEPTRETSTTVSRPRFAVLEPSRSACNRLAQRARTPGRVAVTARLGLGGNVDYQRGCAVIAD